jgi:type II secretory pathway pseudopilin PulG
MVTMYLLEKSVKRKKYNIASSKALTTMEMIISVAIISIVFAAILPQFSNINNSWASRQENLEIVQTGRITIEHMRNNLSKAVKISAVSAPSVTNGFIEYEAIDGITYRYAIANGNIRFGPVDNLNVLANSVTSLQFKCYTLNDLDTTTTDTKLIRFIEVDTTLITASSRSKSFEVSVYIQTNHLKGLTMSTPGYFGDTSGNTPTLAKIDDDHYLCAFTGSGDDGWATVLTTDVDDFTVSSESAFEYDTAAGKNPSLQKIDDRHYLCAYQGAGNDGWAVVLNVNKSTWNISANTPLEYDTQAGIYPDLIKIDSQHFLCVYTGKAGNGWAALLSVDTSTWEITLESSLQFDSSACQNPIVTHIKGDEYLCVYEGFQQKGFASILNIDKNTWAITQLNNTQYSQSWYYTPALVQLNENKYFNPHAYFTGWAVVMRINLSTWSVSKGSTFVWENYEFVGRPVLAQIANSDEFLCVHKGASQHLNYTIFSVNTATSKITETNSGELTDYKAHWPDLIKIDDDNYLCVFEDQTNGGWATIINVGDGGSLTP